MTKSCDICMCEIGTWVVCERKKKLWSLNMVGLPSPIRNENNNKTKWWKKISFFICFLKILKNNLNNAYNFFLLLFVRLYCCYLTLRIWCVVKLEAPPDDANVDFGRGEIFLFTNTYNIIYHHHRHIWKSDRNNFIPQGVNVNLFSAFSALHNWHLSFRSKFSWTTI